MHGPGGELYCLAGSKGQELVMSDICKYSKLSDEIGAEHACLHIGDNKFPLVLSFSYVRG